MMSDDTQETPPRPAPASLDEELAARVDAILDQMRQMGELVIAYSGGVDSSVVAALAHRAVGDQAVAVTAVSETLAGRELAEARQIAAEIGIRHEQIAFSELEDERFVANTSARCFFCQTMRFGQLRAMAERLGCEVVASGSNASDLGEHRPGLEAMKDQRVYQPLLAHQITKAQVRQIARWLGLSVWDKPAKACLSSRIPHGLEVTESRLRRIERAEEVLHEMGFGQYRVRDHGGLARVEIASEEMARALEPERMRRMARGIRQAGFARVTLDLIGYRAGSVSAPASGSPV